MKKIFKKSSLSVSVDMKIIYRYAKNGFCIISAYKPEYSETEYMDKHRKLCEIIHSKNLKFIEVVGHWEDENINSDKKLEARVLFIPFCEISIQDDLLALSAFLMTKFSQEAIVYYDPNSSILLYKNDRVSEIKEFNFQKILTDYFVNSKASLNEKFIIDGRVIPNGLFEKYLLKKKGYIF